MNNKDEYVDFSKKLNEQKVSTVIIEKWEEYLNLINKLKIDTMNYTEFLSDGSEFPKKIFSELQLISYLLYTIGGSLEKILEIQVMIIRRYSIGTRIDWLKTKNDM